MSATLNQMKRYKLAILLIPLVLLLAGVTFAMVTAHLGSRYPLTFREERGKAGTDELVVLVHGFNRGPKMMAGISQAVREIKPDADIVIFDYNRYAFSDGSPFRISERMDEMIEELQTKRGYRKIVLGGFSMGALLIRKAYVYGCGSIADAPTLGGKRTVSSEPREWVKHVQRFVLLAGMNRGWNPDHRAKYTPLHERSVAAIGWWLARLTNTGLLLRSTIRGEPFVANLRLQWLEVMRGAAAKGIPRPQVIQLLGDRDDVVTKDDSRDVTVARDFIWVPVDNTSHGEIVQVGDAGTMRERKRKIQQAFGDEGSIENMKRSSPVLMMDEDPKVEAVVFILHGIRDMGEWTSNFEEPLQKAYLETHPGGGRLHVHRASYGFLTMGPFLLWEDRQKNVRWFMDQVTELTARFPNLKEIHFIGHSNGTYVLASALQNYNTLKLGNAVLAGSVVRRDFPWGEYSGRIKRIRNYVGSSDIVVGFFPRLFELPLLTALNHDIGSAGFNGFTDPFGNANETRFVRGAHDAALVKANIPSIVDFIIHGKKTEVESVVTQDRSNYLQLLSNCCWLVWLFLVVLMLAFGYGIFAMSGCLAPHITSRFTWIPRRVTLGGSIGAYVMLIWYLLITI